MNAINSEDIKILTSRGLLDEKRLRDYKIFEAFQNYTSDKKNKLKDVYKKISNEFNLSVIQIERIIGKMKNDLYFSSTTRAAS